MPEQHAARYKIAEMLLNMELRDERIAIPDRFQPFACDRGPADITLTFTRGPIYSPAVAERIYQWRFANARYELFSTAREEYCLVCANGSGFANRIAVYSADFSMCRVRTTCDEIPAWQKEFETDTIVQILLCNYLLARKLGLLVHCAAVQTEVERGVLFVGESGAGKSTMAAIWRAGNQSVVIGEEFNLVRIDGRGVRAFASPWYRDTGLFHNGYLPLDRAFLISHGPRNRVLELDPAQRVSVFYSQLFPLMASRTHIENALLLVETLDREAGIRGLEFVPTEEVIELVRRGQV